MLRFIPPEAFKTHTDFEQQMIACEICGAQRAFRDMNSIAVGYRFPGKVDEGHRSVWLPAYQCPDVQHFGCCHEHAMLAAAACLILHIHEGPHNAHGTPLEHDILVRLRSDLEALMQEEKAEGPIDDLLEAGEGS